MLTQREGRDNTAPVYYLKKPNDTYEHYHSYDNMHANAGFEDVMVCVRGTYETILKLKSPDV